MKRSCLAVFASAALATAFASQQAEAVTFSADADAFYQLGAPTSTSGGSSTQLTVKDSGGGTTTRKAWIRFDVSGSPIDDLLSANLELTVSQRSSGGPASNPSPQLDYPIQVFGLNDGNAGENWDESTTTWNTAPANNTANNGVIGAQTTFLGGFTIPGTANVGDVFNFTSAAFEQFLKDDADGLVTFIIRRNGGSGSNNLSFASKENTGLTGPLLNVELPAVPEPATAGLSLLGLAVLARRRRKA